MPPRGSPWAKPTSVDVPNYPESQGGGSSMAWLAPFVGSLAGAGATAYGASQGDKLKTQQVQAPGWSRGLQNMFARAIAQNAFNTAPSFGDFISSGGTARFPTNFTGMSPQEARLLGFVGNAGEPLPFTDIGRVGEQPAQADLTPAQRLYLGAQDLKSGRQGPLRNLAKKYQRYKSLEKKSEDPYITDRRKARLEGRMTRTGAKLEDLYNAVMRRGYGTGENYAGDPAYDVPPTAYEAGARPYLNRRTGKGRRSSNDYDTMAMLEDIGSMGLKGNYRRR